MRPVFRGVKIAVELRELPLDGGEYKLPRWVTERIESGQRAIEVFRVVEHRDPVNEFHASDFELAFGLMRWATRCVQPAPTSFCEWGCGIPLVSSLADGLGLAVNAIEIDPRLYNAAAKWLGTFSNQVQLRRGSFVAASDLDLIRLYPPTGGLRFDTTCDEDLSAYAAASIVYAYPWPGEDQLFVELFKRHAPAGAILISFHGSDEFRLRQKM